MKGQNGVIRVPGSPYGSVRPVRLYTERGWFLGEVLEPFNINIDRNRTKAQLKILKATEKGPS